MQTRYNFVTAAFFALSFTLFSCSKEPSADPENNLSALPKQVINPADNISTPEKIKLGKLLFWDPVLSGNKDVACATCHHPDYGYTDNLDLPIGANGKGLGSKRCFNSPNSIPYAKRNAPTILNAAFNGIDISGLYDPKAAPMFYDLRAQSLEAQSLGPIAQLEEMRGNNYTENGALDSVVIRLKNIPEYVQLFTNVFGNNNINTENIGKAIACFERTLITTETPFDLYMRGEKNALSDKQKSGMTVFLNAGCNKCHNGPMFSDFKVHVLGVKDNTKLINYDKGQNNTYAFRTPTLRNLKYTAPYMHNGTESTLQDVIKFYADAGRNRGTSANANVSKNQLDKDLPGLVDPEDVDNLVEFLNALSVNNYDKTIPETVPSRLKVGGNIN